MDTARAGNPATRWFGDRTVGTKILAAVSLAAAVGGIVGGVAVSRMNTLADSAQALYAESVVGVGAADDLLASGLRTRLGLVNVLVAQGEAATEQTEDALAAEDEVFNATFATYKELDAGEHSAELGQLQESWVAYKQVRDTKLLQLARESKTAESFTVRAEEADASIATSFELIEGLVEDEAAEAKELAADAPPRHAAPATRSWPSWSSGSRSRSCSGG